MSDHLIAYLVALFFGGFIIGLEGAERHWRLPRTFIACVVYASVIFLVGAPV